MIMNKEQQDKITNAFNYAYAILNKCSEVNPITEDDKRNIRDRAEQIVQSLGKVLTKEV
tara:strand:- start:2972 stop:3148 length:177 start_codon:yes stop_codon:yes gene_type:complete